MGNKSSQEAALPSISTNGRSRKRPVIIDPVVNLPISEGHNKHRPILTTSESALYWTDANDRRTQLGGYYFRPDLHQLGLQREPETARSRMYVRRLQPGGTQDTNSKAQFIHYVKKPSKQMLRAARLVNKGTEEKKEEVQVDNPAIFARETKTLPSKSIRRLNMGGSTRVDASSSLLTRATALDVVTDSNGASISDDHQSSMQSRSGDSKDEGMDVVSQSLPSQRRWSGTYEKKTPATCGICFSSYKEPLEANCGHYYCKECWVAWSEEHAMDEQDLQCPECEKPVDLDLLFAVKLCAMCAYKPINQWKSRCGHIGCQHCWRAHLRAEKRTECPVADCHEYINASDIGQIVSPMLKSRRTSVETAQPKTGSLKNRNKIEQDSQQTTSEQPDAKEEQDDTAGGLQPIRDNDGQNTKEDDAIEGSNAAEETNNQNETPKKDGEEVFGQE